MSALLLWSAAAGAAPEVLELVTAADVQRREPVGVTTSFAAGTELVWGHLRVRNEEAPAKIALVWRQDGREVGRETLKVGVGARWRTWTKLRMGPEHAGRWTLEVLDGDGRPLASTAFTVGAGAAPEEASAAAVPVAEVPAAEVPAAEPPAIPTPRVIIAEPGDTCRALVNLAVGTRQHAVAEVRVGARITAARADGLAVVDGDDVYAVLLTRREKVDRAGHGQVRRAWELLDGVAVDGGAPSRWHGYPSTLPVPEHGQPRAKEFSEENRLEVLAVLGPYVSLLARLQGYAGGDHGYDNSRYALVRAPGRTVSPELVVDADLKTLALERVRTLRPTGQGPRPEPMKHDFRKSALVQVGPTLSLRTLMPCCTFAENRGLLEVDLPLSPPPRALRPYLPGPDGLVAAPDGCGAIGWAGGRLLARQGAAGAAEVVALPGSRPRGVLGVAWLPPDSDFSLERFRAAVKRLSP